MLLQHESLEQSDQTSSTSQDVKLKSRNNVMSVFPDDFSYSNIKTIFTAISFCFTSQSLLTSSLISCALCILPVHEIQIFVAKNSRILSYMGLSLVPGTFALCCGTAAAIKLILPSPTCDLVAGVYMIMVGALGIVGFGLVRQNHHMRKRLLHHLLV
jgi:hypothetical protein